MKDKDKRKFVSIQSKVDARTAARLDAIVERGKFRARYQLMQYILSAFLRVADAENEETEVERETKYMRECEKMFSNWMDVRSRIITTNPCKTTKLNLIKSFYVYSKTGKRGCVVKEVSGGNDRIFVNSSVDHALAEVLRLLHPELYARLVDLGAETGDCNMRVIIESLCEEKPLISKKNEVGEEFDELAPTPDYGNKAMQTRTRKV